MQAAASGLRAERFQKNMNSLAVTPAAPCLWKAVTFPQAEVMGILSPHCHPGQDRKSVAGCDPYPRRGPQHTVDGGQEAEAHPRVLLRHLLDQGFVINVENSMLSPAQDIVFWRCPCFPGVRRCIVEQIRARHGQATVDLFTSRENAQRALFYSPGRRHTSACLATCVS